MSAAQTAQAAVSVLVVEDDDAYRTFLVGELNDLGYGVDGVGDGQSALERLGGNEYDVVLMDIRLPGIDGLEVLRRLKESTGGASPHVIVLTGHGSIDTAIEAMKLGAYDYLTKPCDIDEMRVVIERAREHADLTRENSALRAILRRRDGPEVIGHSPAVRDMLDRIARIAPTEATVLLVGESGTGKELAAQRLHRLSGRAEKPFVDINCGAIQESLFESEFFGHERGSFTGASVQKTGLVEAADGGTLFLDEVSEMPVSAQVKLLRFLETGQFRRVGGVRAHRADVRVVAATNRLLNEWVADGRFREDLYFRLAVCTIEVPPLRERGSDVALLADYFVRIFSAKLGRHVNGFDESALALLMAHAWPGNVRELRNAVENAVILAEGNVVTARDLPSYLSRQVATGAAEGVPALAGASTGGEIPTLAELERRHIEAVLDLMGGHRERTAKVLGIATKTLYRKLREFGIGDPAPGRAK